MAIIVAFKPVPSTWYPVPSPQYPVTRRVPHFPRVLWARNGISPCQQLFRSSSPGTVTALPAFRSCMRRATSSSQAACTESCASSRLSSRVLASAARSSTERASARFKSSETSGLIVLFYLWISAANIFCVIRLRRRSPFCFAGSILKDRRYPLPPGPCGIIGLARKSL